MNVVYVALSPSRFANSAMEKSALEYSSVSAPAPGT